jgi:uncharacterized membrane protein
MIDVSFLPAPLVVFLMAMLPFGELRLSIPVAILHFHMDPFTAFTISVLGNILPVPFILVLFHRVEKYLRKYDRFNRLFDRLFDRTIRRAKARIHTYEEIALILFVAIPAPFTGAWTGALIAYLFDLENKKSFLVICLGVIIDGIIVTAFVIWGGGFFGMS